MSRTDPRLERADERAAMVETQIAARGIRDSRVLEAMRAVPRHAFVPDELQAVAYDDTPLPIGLGQTISQPYIVALMTELTQPHAAARILEIGTGSGYQAAVLACLCAEVLTVEIVGHHAATAERRLHELGIANVRVRHADGHAGWPEESPFEAIVVTAAPAVVPQALAGQLKAGGRLVIPVGPAGGVQVLQCFTKCADGGLSGEDVLAVRFVPLTGGGRGG
jgi:protein-L-isoaspartate(D-aspartate) O-methyltransferase